MIVPLITTLNNSKSNTSQPSTVNCCDLRVEWTYSLRFQFSTTEEPKSWDDCDVNRLLAMELAHNKILFTLSFTLWTVTLLSTSFIINCTCTILRVSTCYSQSRLIHLKGVTAKLWKKTKIKTKLEASNYRTLWLFVSCAIAPSQSVSV